jgi:hypothetical protein
MHHLTALDHNKRTTMRIVVSALAFASHTAAAQTVLKEEPKRGALKSIVLVDDGSCPTGTMAARA